MIGPVSKDVYSFFRVLHTPGQCFGVMRFDDSDNIKFANGHTGFYEISALGMDPSETSMIVVSKTGSTLLEIFEFRTSDGAMIKKYSTTSYSSNMFLAELVINSANTAAALAVVNAVNTVSICKLTFATNNLS